MIGTGTESTPRHAAISSLTKNSEHRYLRIRLISKKPQLAVKVKNCGVHGYFQSGGSTSQRLRLARAGATPTQLANVKSKLHIPVEGGTLHSSWEPLMKVPSLSSPGRGNRRLHGDLRRNSSITNCALSPLTALRPINKPQSSDQTMSSTSRVLSDLGFNFIIKVVRIAFEATFYGIYILLICASTSILAQSRLRSRWKIYLLCITLVMFAGSTLFFALDIADIVERLKITLMDHSNLDVIQDRVNLADAKTKSLTWTGEMLFVFMLILGDTVVLWRTWLIYYGKRTYVLIPFLTWLGSVVAGVYELGCDIKTHWGFLDPNPSAGSQGALSCARADMSTFTLSYATNIICTTLIFLRVWGFRRSVVKYLASVRRDAQAEKIMVLLIESGLFYLAIYTLQAVPIYAGYSPGSPIVWESINAIIQQAFGMYPTAIVVLVYLQKSLWETDEVSRQLIRSQSVVSTPTSSAALATSKTLGDTSTNASPRSQFLHGKIEPYDRMPFV
ncbi:hypothetical protein APHAL10511_004059 [Amanita phalloides]|nr:hypothetical protein APHAL10511_004059 [Amanita phalloides]